MPLTAADFEPQPEAPAEASLTTSQAQQAQAAPQAAPAPQQAPDFMTTPPSQQNASLRRPRGGTSAYPGGLVDEFERNRKAINSLPAFLQPLAVLGERFAQPIDAAARLGQDIFRTMRMQPPKQGVVQSASDIGEVVAGAVAPEAVAFGAATDALSRQLGADEDSARWLSGAAEALPLPGKMFMEGRRAFERGRGMLTSGGTRLTRGAAGTTPAAQRIAPRAGEDAVDKIGRNLKALVPNQLHKRGNQLGPEIGRIERRFANTGATLDPTDPLYTRYEQDLLQAEQISDLNGPAGRKLEQIKARFATNQPVAVSDMADIRHMLVEPARAARGKAEPGLAAAAAAKIRSDTARTIKEMMPRTEALAYQGARMKYAREVGRPQRILAMAYRDTTSPRTLFNAVYTGQDPYTLSTVLEVAKHNPPLKAKLALGYLENLASGTNNWQDAGSALAAMKNTRGLVENHGLLSTRDLDDLEYFLKRRSLPQVIESFQALVGTMSGAVKGSAATGMAYVASGKPSHMLMALTASGSLSPLRRLMLVPKGSNTWKRASLQIAGNIAKFVGDVSQASQEADGGEEAITNLLAPKMR